MNFQNFSDRIKALFLFLFLFLVLIAFAFLTKNILSTIVISLVFCVLLFITKSLWLPEGYGKTLVRTLSLSIALAAFVSYGFWQNFIQSITVNFLNRHFPHIVDNYAVQNLPSGLLLVFLLLVIFIVNYFIRDVTGMGVHPTPINEDIPEPTYKERLNRVCESLTDDLRSIDIRTNWSSQYFTPLDAEVEVNTYSGKEKKVTDLLKAIKRSKKRLFLVLGDPGSGKSVALRKLCQDLRSEVLKTGKIPIYINLKEWVVEKKWDEENPPKVEQLYEFVYKNIRDRDIVSNKFFEQYFSRLYEAGRLYFVLDSFDEIPAVLDERENSELIKKLSEVCFKFLKGARAEESQGILSSRIFRKPTSEFQAEIILEIRPFTEEKIIMTLKRSGYYNNDLINELFKKRTELVPIARNPFSATLISEFAEKNNNKLPSNQSEMYADYIQRTLESCSDRIEKQNLQIENVIDGAIAIADQMFEKFALEASVKDLRKSLPLFDIDAIVDILKFARLGRAGTGDSNRFSFVHRRFTEYFYIQKILQENKSIDITSIPNDSQLRDALVLYAEVANEEKATEIAQFCWEVIKRHNDPLNPAVIHCMRFLRDAYKGRLNCIQNFRKELTTYIFDHINPSKNIITVKFAIETLGLLEEKEIDKGVRAAMEIGNEWINETAFKSCRHLPKISEDLENSIINYINKIPLLAFIKQRNNIKFSLELSDSFKTISFFFKVKQIQIAFIFFVLFISMILLPHAFIPVYSLTFLFFLLFLTQPFFSFRQKINSVDTFISITSVIAIVICLIIPFYMLTLIDFLQSHGFLTLNEENKNDKVLSYLTRNKYLFLLLGLFHLIILLGFHNMFFFNKIIKTKNIKRLKFLVGAITISLLSAPLFLIILRKYPSLFNIISIMHSVLISVLVILTVLLFSRSSYKGYMIYKKINIVLCNNRKYIFDTFNKLEVSTHYQLKFILLLENNIKEVNGEWPISDFLVIENKRNKDVIFKFVSFILRSTTFSKNTTNNNEAFIRLAKLEEKWLGLER